MIYEYNDEVGEEGTTENLAEEPQPDTEEEFLNAKSFLQKCSPMSGDNLYDHLTDVLNRILSERPENVVDFFEDYSRKMKEHRFKPKTDHFEDMYVPPGRHALARKLMPLYRPLPEVESIDPEDSNLADMSRNDMLQLCYFFEHAGLGLPRTEMFSILLMMRQLIRVEPIATIRFWGKIHGLFKNYLVIETELKEEEIAKRTEIFNEAAEKLLEGESQNPDDELAKTLEHLAQTKEEEERGEGKKIPRILPPRPINTYEEMPEAPSEAPGIGVNKKVFYVCNEAGDSWMQLPDVTPQQIRVARQIKKSFTGFLDQSIVTYPHFPGKEIDYLRAQIARISAATQISPMGFYTFKEEGGEEEEEEAEDEEAEKGPKTSYKENSRYEPPPIRDLIDRSMTFWVHNTLHILPQGRTMWWNPYPSPDMGEEEAGEEEEVNVGPHVEPETGPPLLTPCSEDASLEAVPAWSVRSSSKILQDYSIAVVRSHLWPGAYCFTNQGKIFQNIYLGYGHKYMSNNFIPVPLPPIEQDYPMGPEIMEMFDPTGQQEEQWRIDHLPKPKPMLGEGEEEGEEEEEED